MKFEPVTIGNPEPRTATALPYKKVRTHKKLHCEVARGEWPPTCQSITDTYTVRITLAATHPGADDSIKASRLRVLSLQRVPGPQEGQCRQ